MMYEIEKPDPNEMPTVQIGETIYSGNELIAYYEDIITALGEQSRSLTNKVQFINAIKILIRKNEYRKAMGAVYQALSGYPGDPAIVRLLIEIFINNKTFDEAHKYLEKFLEDNPHDLSFKILKAKIYRMENKSGEEEQALLEVLAVPTYDFMDNRYKLTAHRRLVEMYLKSRDYEKAESAVKELLKRSKDESNWSLLFEVLFQAGKKDELQQAKDEFATYRRAKVYFEKGEKAEAARKLDMAYSKYRKGLHIYPDEAEISARAGSILMRRKKWYSRAEEYFRKAVELDPDQAGYLENLALCMKNQGKNKEAYQLAKKAAMMDPSSNSYVLYTLAVKLGKEKEFEELILSAVREDTVGEFPKLRFDLGLYYEDKGDVKESSRWFEEALEFYKKQLKQYPDDWEIFLEIGDCYFHMRNFEKAEKYYKKSEELVNGPAVDIYERLVEIYHKTNHPEKVDPYLKKMIRSNPGRLINYLDLGINLLSRVTSHMRKRESLDRKEKGD